jgi:hypothetical protein
METNDIYQFFLPEPGPAMFKTLSFSFVSGKCFLPYRCPALMVDLAGAEYLFSIHGCFFRWLQVIPIVSETLDCSATKARDRSPADGLRPRLSLSFSA